MLPIKPFLQGVLKGSLYAYVAAFAVFLLAASYFAGKRHAQQACAQAQAQAITKAATAAAKATAATQAVADMSASKQAEIHTIFKDRIVKQYVEVPREVIAQENAACAISNRFVSLWNSANRAELPTFAAQLDASASRVAISDVSAQHEREAELCHANTEQLKALQAAELARQQVQEDAQ